MKKKKCILLFDDKEQTKIIDSIKLSTRQEFDLDFIFIRTSSPDLKKKDSEDLDTEKLKKEIATKTHGKQIDIALTDFDLACDYLNGLDVIHMVHETRKKLNFFVYSGNWDKVIRRVIGENYQKASSEQLVEGINQLIHDKIIDCISRIDYQEDLIKYLQHNSEDSMEHRLCTLLRSNGDMVFNSCCPKLKGKTFDEIADMIDNHSDARSDEWIETVLTQTIAYLVKVNQ
jgi:hypothetical protein